MSVNSEWLSFARENEAASLCSEGVVGERLFRFVADPETRHLYEMIIDAVRSDGRRVTIPFRCDGPAVRRFMELDISQGSEGQVLFESRIVREETREPVSLFDTSVDRSDDFLVVCSWCKRVDASGDWVEVEEAVARLKLFDTARLPQMTHGMCADCAARLQRELD